MSIPTILQAPDTATLLRLWLHQYYIGRNTGVSLQLLGASAFAYLAVFMPSGELARTYAMAGLAMLGIGLFTLALIVPVNVNLQSALETVQMGGKEAVEVRDDDIRGLMKVWQRRNYGRLLMSVTALALAMRATLF